MKKISGLFFLLGINFFSGMASAPTIFVPRQLSYNPIFENAIVLSSKVYNQDRSLDFFKNEKFIISAKPLYTQNVGLKCGKYFTIDHKPVMNVQEDGSGDIGSLWFQNVNTASYYSSDISFNPKRRTLGMMLYGSLNIANHVSCSANTAVITTSNNMNIYEYNNPDFSAVPGLGTLSQAFANKNLQYGAIRGTQTKSGVDDIQLKLMYHSYDADQDAYQEDQNFYYQVYALVGIPTGQGSQAQYLFEPLVGSKHAQIGFGGNLHYYAGSIKFQAEAKWRYAFSGDEMRSFDLTKNGQWSRYMLIVNSLFPYGFYQAINGFTFSTQVTPQNSFDVYLAAYWDLDEKWQLEVGYDFWIRQAEKISIALILPAPSIGIADIFDISRMNPPTSASGANISQGVIVGQNCVVPDSAFVAIQPSDFNLASAAAPRSVSNSIYGSLGYTKELRKHLVRTGLGLAYECGHGINVPNNISAWINLEISF